MRNILTVVALSLMFVVSTSSVAFSKGNRYNQRYQQPRRVVHVHKHKSVNPWEVAGAVTATVVGIKLVDVLINGPRPQRQIVYQQTPVVYSQQPVSYQSRAVQQRERQHEMTIQRYYDCLGQREVDIRYGVHPQDAKDCSRLHPQNRNWR